jgi:hypothetical protein
MNKLQDETAARFDNLEATMTAHLDALGVLLQANTAARSHADALGGGEGRECVDIRGSAGGGRIEEWLRAISLQQYTAAMKEYGYDSLEALDAALEADLEEMAADPTVGMKKPHRCLLITEWKKRSQKVVLAAGAANQGPLGEFLTQQGSCVGRPLTRAVTSEEKLSERGGLDVSAPIVPARMHPESEGVNDSEDDSMDWSVGSERQISRANTTKDGHDTAMDEAAAKISSIPCAWLHGNSSAHEPTEIVISERPVLAGVELTAAQRKLALAGGSAALSETSHKTLLSGMVRAHSDSMC